MKIKEKLDLTLSWSDCFKLVNQGGGVYIGLAGGFAYAWFKGLLGIEHIYYYVILVALMVGIPLLGAKYTVYLTLGKSSLDFKNWRGRNVPVKWDAPLEIKEMGKGVSTFVYIRYLPAKARCKIPKVVFSYPDVQKALFEYAPESHPLRQLTTRS